MSDILLKAEELQQSGNQYCIDYLPRRLATQDYFELEEYFVDTFLQSFSEKIVRIVFKLIYYYSAELCLTELPCDYSGDLSNYDVGKNIRQLPLKEISNIINEAIMTDKSSVLILLNTDADCNICINGGFSVSVYSTNSEIIEFISVLVTQENLFLRGETE